jgi:hypothetical protein
MWIETLRKEVGTKGLGQVAWELGISRATVSLVLNGRYRANPERVMKRVISIYGDPQGVNCPVKGMITPYKCAENHGRAKAIGMKAGNPETLRLFKACLKCKIRG